MLNAGVLRFDALGKVRNTTVAGSEFNAGVESEQGLVSVSLNTPQRWHNGLPFMNNGALSVQNVGTVAYHSQGGIPINELGAVAIDTVGAVAYWNAGLPFTSGGKLAFAASEPPATLSGFSSGFDEGFA
jgi:hypothetical protein